MGAVRSLTLLPNGPCTDDDAPISKDRVNDAVAKEIRARFSHADGKDVLKRIRHEPLDAALLRRRHCERFPAELSTGREKKGAERRLVPHAGPIAGSTMMG
jgi:hypothetical protein